jgi:hypothetical protein
MRHLFQGRFKAVIVQDDRGWQEVARYVRESQKLSPSEMNLFGADGTK